MELNIILVLVRHFNAVKNWLVGFAAAVALCLVAIHATAQDAPFELDRPESANR